MLKLMILATLNAWRPGEGGPGQAQVAMTPILTGSSLPAGLHVRVGFVDWDERQRGLAGVARVVDMPRLEFYSLSAAGVFVWEALMLGAAQLAPYVEWADKNKG